MLDEKKEKMKKIIIFSIILLLHNIHADEWLFSTGKSESKFDDVTIIQITESEQKFSSYPNFFLEFYKNRQLQAKLKNVHCDAIFQTPDKNFIIGLSNQGVPGTAYIVFDMYGNLLREVRHDCFDFIEYCSTSLTIRRDWIDIKNPQIKCYKGQFNQIIEVTGCNGKKYNLLNRGFSIDEGFFYNKSDSLDNKYNNIVNEDIFEEKNKE